MDNFGVSSALLDAYAVAEKNLLEMKRRVSEAALANIGLKKGDLVLDEDSGLQYRIDYCSAYVYGDRQVNIIVMGRRVWKSGRKAGKEAHSSSSLRFRGLNKVEADNG